MRFDLMLPGLAAACLSAGTAMAQSAGHGPAPGPAPVTQGPHVEGSPNSVIANTLNVRTMNIYQAARHDERTRRFTTALRSYVQSMMTQATQMDGQPLYAFAIDLGTRRTGENLVIYQLLAGPAEGITNIYGSSAASCEVGNGVALSGITLRRSADPGATTIGARLLTRADQPLLDRICRGLRMPVSSLVPGGGSYPGGPSVYEYLKRNQNGVSLSLFASELGAHSLEEDWFRYYWIEPLVLRYRHAPTTLPADMFSQLPGFGRGEAATGRFPGSNVGTDPLFLPEARDEFGPLLDRLETDWTSFLSTSMVTLRNEHHPLMSQGHVARVLRRFRPDELGSVEFWRSAEDVTNALQQATCIAQQFLVEKEYVDPEAAPATERCALSDIRLPAGQARGG